MPVSSQERHPKGNIAGRDLGDEYLIYDRSSDSVHVLKGTARDIFLLCDGNHTTEQIAAALVAEYDVDESTARHDTERTLRELSELGALIWN